MERLTIHTVRGRLFVALALVALTASWVPRHLACSGHHPATDASATAEGHCATGADGTDGPEWAKTSCCGPQGIAALCCMARDSGPMLVDRSADAPRAREFKAIPGVDAPGRVEVDHREDRDASGAGDLPPPVRHRYRDLSVLRL